MLTESQILNIEKLLNEAIENLKVGIKDEPSPTFEWDLTGLKIKESTKKIKTVEQAKKYLDILFNLIKSIPEKLKLKILKFVFLSLSGILTYSQFYDYTVENQPTLKNTISTLESDLNLNKTKVNSNSNIISKIKEKKYYHTPKTSSEKLKTFLKKEEGKVGKKGEPVLTAYDINDGAITIGWGHAEKKNISKYRTGDKISIKKAEELFKKDLSYAEDAVNDIFKKWKEKGISFYIDQNMYDAMVSMAFNMGRAGLWESNFIQLVKQGKYKEAKEKILTTNVTFEGHIDRRKGESEMFGKNLDNNPLLKSKEDKNQMITESYKERLRKLAGLI